jgi:hypothetical protein
LVLRGHPASDGHWVLATSLLLLLLEVLVVRHLLLLFVGHVTRVHSGAHVALWCVDIVVSHVLGSLGGDIGGIYAILASGGVGSVQACLLSD